MAYKPKVLAVAEGGTGDTTLTSHGVLIGAGTSAVAATAAGSAGQVLQSAGASADPTYSTATFPSTATGTGTILRADGTNWVATTATYPTTAGSSGNVLTSDGTNWTSAAPSAGGFTWSVITADQSAVTNHGYICNKAGLLTLTLPASPATGDLFEVTGMNTALGWKIAQNANQVIHFFGSNTTTGTSGYLASSATRDSVGLVCVVAGSSAEWNTFSSGGNITVV